MCQGERTGEFILLDLGNAKLLVNNNSRSLTEHEGRTGEYWPEVVAVQTSLCSVRTATTKGQCSPVQPEQAQLVSCLLYGTLFLIVKCTSGAINLFSFLSF